MKRFLRQLAGWGLGGVMLLLKATCRVKIYNDPRGDLAAAGESYAFAILHAHQIAAGINGDPGTAAMISQSADGDLLVPGFRAMGMTAIRGSNRGQNCDKGGREAIEQMIQHVRGGQPGIIAVDGPRGPRNHVRKGIAVVSRNSGGAVLCVACIPSRRWILGSWDRLQIPMPFSRIDAYFAPPLRPDRNESVEEYRRRIEAALNELELRHDPEQSSGQSVPPRRQRAA